MVEDVRMVNEEEIESNQISMRQPIKKTPNVPTSSADISQMLMQHKTDKQRILDPKLLASKLLSSALQHNWSEQVEVSADKNGSNVSSAPNMGSPRVSI